MPVHAIAAALVVVLLSGCGSASPGALGPSAPTGAASMIVRPTPNSPEATAVEPERPSRSSSPRAVPTTPEATDARGSPSATSALPADWPVYHRDAARTGNDPTFPSPPRSLSLAWSTALHGPVYGQPLIVRGRVIAATEWDWVYALDPASGRIVWQRHLGTPVPRSALPCGNIDPLGITSTPAFDAMTGTLFVVAEVSGPRHVLFALDAATGVVRWSRAIDLPGDDRATHQQRAALAIGNGFAYIGMGGLYGDCGQYRGEVIGVPTSGRGTTIAYRVPTQREGAVWATGGPVQDAHGNLYVSIGNGSSTTIYDGSDSVVELSPSLAPLSRFAPSTWAQDNAADLDLGSLSPVLVPGGWVFIAGKSGTGYVLRQGALGGIGGEIASASVCAAFGGAAQAGATIYVPCPGGLAKVQITAGGAIHMAWRTDSGADGPPVIGGDTIWSLDLGRGVLFALDPATGDTIATVSVGPVPHFASPTLWDGRVLVGTMTGVTSAAVR